MNDDYDITCIKNDVCNMAICDKLDCKHRIEKINEWINQLPDCYAGELNKQRIKQYRMLAHKFGIDELIAMHCFCEGIDWYKKKIEDGMSKEKDKV